VLLKISYLLKGRILGEAVLVFRNRGPAVHQLNAYPDLTLADELRSVLK